MTGIGVVSMAKEDKEPPDPLFRFRSEILGKGDLLLNLPFEGIYVLDEKGFLVDMSDTFCSSLGYSREEMNGMHVSGWNAVWDDPVVSAQFESLVQNPHRRTITFETVHRTKSGRLIPVEIRASSIRLDMGVFVYCSSRDKTAEIKARHLSEINDLMLRVNQEISTVENEGVLLSRICEMSVEFGHLSLAWVGRPDDSGKFLFLASSGDTEYLDGIEISSDPGLLFGNGPAGRAFREDRAIFFGNFESDRRLGPWRERASLFHFQTTASLPIHRGGQVWGVLVVYHKDMDFLNTEMKTLLEELARDISRGLDRLDARVRERELFAVHQALLDNTVVGIAMTQGRRLSFVNFRLLELLGYDNPEELLGQSTHVLYPDEEEYFRIGTVHSEIDKKGTVGITGVRLVKKDGTILLCDVSASLVSMTPEKKAVWTIEDVTEKHHRTEKIKLLLGLNKMLAQVNMAVAEAQEELSLIRSICDLVVQLGHMELAWIGRADDSGAFSFLASSGESGYLEKMAVSPDDPCGLGPAGQALREGRAVFTGSLRDSHSPWVEEARNFGMNSAAALSIFRKGKIWGFLAVYHRAEGFFDEDDLKSLFLELALDISRGLDRIDDQKSRWLLSNALSSIEDGVAITDSSHLVTWVNKAFTTVTGYAPDEIAGKNLKILQSPETDSETVEDIRQSLKTGTVFHGQILNLQKDGSKFWNLLTINPMHDASGTITGFVGVQRDISDMVALKEQLEFQSLHDPLTGLPNRRALDQHLAMAMARSRRNGTVVALGLLDLDDFKAVNDRFGHSAGDRLLIDLVARLEARLRENDFLVRLGGDEFIIVVEDLLEELVPGQIEPFLHRLHEVVEAPFIVSNGQQAFVGMSLGLAFYPLDATEGDALVRQADIAMYKLKKEKDNRTVWWQRTDQSSHMAGSPEQLKSSDPYGSVVKVLLGGYQREIAVVIEKVVGSFFDKLALESEPAVIFSSLSPEEMMRLRLRQVEHLKFLLNPETTREAILARATEIGRIHCLVGVGNTLLLKGKSFYVRYLKDYLDQEILVLMDRTYILVAAEWRLHEDVESQLRSEVTTMDHYQRILSLPLPPKGIMWTEARAIEVRELGRLPGVQAVLLVKPDSRGVFVIEENGGAVGEVGSFVLRTQSLEPVIDPASPRGQGLLSRTWRSLHFQTAPSFHLDPTLAPWLDVVTRLGINSAMVLLVRDDSKKPVAAIAIYGAYPNQFESSWMKQFALGVEQRWGKIWTLSQH